MPASPPPPAPAPGKTKIPRARAEKVASAVMAYLGEFCDRWEIAGSIRREKPDVSDVEIVYISGTRARPSGDLFGTQLLTKSMDDAIEVLREHGILEKRLSVTGKATYGRSNKLMRHVRSGVPIDFFAATDENWWPTMVSRTGGTASNLEIATRAKRLGWQWNPYGRGFTNLANGEIRAINSEEDAFSFVGMPYLPPSQRA